jgi:hypothetical protein
MDSKATWKTDDGEILEHRSLSVWSEEFQVFLGENNPQLISNLTDLFDSPKKWNYATLKRGVEDVGYCWLNIVGAITPRLLQNKLSQDAVGGGLISRIIFIVAYGREKPVPLPFLSQEELDLRDKLIEDLAQIKSLQGEFSMTQSAAQLYVDWYMDPASDQVLDSDKFVGYNSRRALHLRKLMMIVSASDGAHEKLINERHFHKALAILQLTEREMPNAFFGVGRGIHSAVLTDIMQAFREQHTMTFADLLDRFKLDVLPSDLQTYLSLLGQTGKVKEERSLSGKVRYVAIEDEKTSSSDEAYLKENIFSKLQGGSE